MAPGGARRQRRIAVNKGETVMGAEVHFVEEGLASKWRRSRLLAQIGDGAGSAYPDWPAVEKLELEVLRGPILAMRDVVAKLSAVALAFQGGPRSDEADALALDQTVRWLSGRR